LDSKEVVLLWLFRFSCRKVGQCYYYFFVSFAGISSSFLSFS
jgi:hypothetical protein